MGFIFSACRNKTCKHSVAKGYRSSVSRNPADETLSYLGVFIRSLLPLLGHSLGLLAGESVDEVEETDRDTGELNHLEEDLPALTLGGLGAGTVGTEGNVVSWSKERIDVSER